MFIRYVKSIMIKKSSLDDVIRFAKDHNFLIEVINSSTCFIFGKQALQVRFYVRTEDRGR